MSPVPPSPPGQGELRERLILRPMRDADTAFRGSSLWTPIGEGRLKAYADAVLALLRDRGGQDDGLKEPCPICGAGAGLGCHEPIHHRERRKAELLERGGQEDEEVTEWTLEVERIPPKRGGQG